MARKMSEDERALRKVIKRMAKQRNWEMVRVLFRDLYNVFLEEEKEARNGREVRSSEVSRTG